MSDMPSDDAGNTPPRGVPSVPQVPQIPPLPPAAASAVAPLPAAPAAGRPAAVFFDGKGSRRHVVTVRPSVGLDIVAEGRVLASWPFEHVRRVAAPTGRLRLRAISGPPLARLDINDPLLQQAVLPRCPELDRDSGGPGQAPRIVGWSLGAVVSIVLLAVYGIPFAAERLTPLVPLSFEQRIGDTVDKQVQAIFGGRRCDVPEGRAALVKLVDKLKVASKLERPLEPGILSTKLPNAFALPGGRIYVTDGLLQKAQNPDEVAGVIAHELGHVQHRDGMRKMVQAGGTSFLIGTLFGDVMGGTAVVFAGRTLVDASYSREAERAADQFAVTTMHALGRSPKPMGEFLFRVTGNQADKSVTILASHPLTEERRALMAKEDRPANGPELLTATEWQALKNVCRTAASDDPAAETPGTSTPRSSTPGSPTPGAAQREASGRGPGSETPAAPRRDTGGDTGRGKQ